MRRPNKRPFKRKLSAGGSSNIPTTIKDPELVQERRLQLVDVATRMFLERGFHATSIRDIVRACPFNLASLYMYVSSKDDILFLVGQELMNEISRRFAETDLDFDAPEAALRAAFDSHCRIVAHYRRHIRLLYRELGVLPPESQNKILGTLRELISLFERILNVGIEQGVFRKVQPELIAMNLVFLPHMLALHGKAIQDVTDLDGFVDEQLDFVLRGLAPAEGKPAARKTRPARHVRVAARTNGL